MAHHPTPTRTRRSALAAAVFALTCTAIATPAFADSDSAKRVLKGMSDYMAGQQNLSSDYDAGLDVVTTEGQKIEFTASGNMSRGRPDKLRATRTGAYSDIAPRGRRLHSAI